MGNHIQIKNMFMQQNTASRQSANSICLVHITAVTKMGQGGLQPMQLEHRILGIMGQFSSGYHYVVPLLLCLHFLGKLA